MGLRMYTLVLPFLAWMIVLVVSAMCIADLLLLLLISCYFNEGSLSIGYQFSCQHVTSSPAMLM